MVADRMHHLLVKQLWLKERVREGALECCHLPTAENVSDLLTKALPRPRHEALRLRCGVVEEVSTGE